MRKLILLILISAVVFAEQVKEKPIAGDPRICTLKEKLPGPCTFLYAPVCGAYYDFDGNLVKQTFSNRCLACKSSLVKYVYNRPCEQFPANAQICIPRNVIDYLCLDVEKPVCGYFNTNINCLVAPCGNTYSNGCYACMDRSVDFYINGSCSELSKDSIDSKQP